MQQSQGTGGKMSKRRSAGNKMQSRMSESVDMTQDDNKTEFDIAMPGIAPEQIKVGLDSGMLTVEASATPTPYTSLWFSRSVLVGDAVKPQDVTTQLRDGVLKVAVKNMGKFQEPVTIPVTT
jgi:HSP20 family molecular chaperone IbpA